MKDDVARNTILQDDRMYETISQDVEPYVEQARIIRESTSDFNKYKHNSFGCLHAGKISLVDIEKLFTGSCCSEGKTYHLMSNDQDEVRRALLHVQTNHKEWLTVKGKPFSKNRAVWH